jgi:hypothetical protein
VLGGCLVLFALVVAAGLRWDQERRLAAECRGNLQKLWSGAERYAAESGGAFPWGPQAPEELVERYLRHDRFRSCPATGARYLWTSRPRKPGDPAHLLLAWEARPHGWPAARHHVLFASGRVADLDSATLRALLAEEKREPPPPPRPTERNPGLRDDPEAIPPGARQPSPLPKPGKPARPEPPGGGEKPAAPAKEAPAHAPQG